MSEKSRVNMRAIGRSIWNFLGSVRVFFWLVVALALLSLSGAFILQDGPPWAYTTLYGEGGAGFIFALGLNDLFHTFSFIALEAWAALALCVCAVNRFRTLGGRRSEDGPGFTAQRTLNLPGEPRQYLPGIGGRLKRARWRVKNFDGGALYADQGRWAWWASPTLHLGLVLFLAAGLVKLVSGQSTYLVLFEGQTQLLPPRFGEPLAAELEVTATGFDTVVDPNSSRVLTYYTELSVDGPGGRETPRIEVNEPYTRVGVTFYQSFVDELEPALLLIGDRGDIASYARSRATYDGARLVIESLELRLTPLEGEEAAQGTGFVTLDLSDEPSPCPGTPWSVAVRGYYPNHLLEPETGADANANPEANPAVRLDVYLGDEPVAEGALVYRLHPEYLDPKLAAAGVRVELGSVRWSHRQEPTLPGGVLALRLFPGEPSEGLEGAWFSLPDGNPALLEVAPPRGLKLTTPEGELILPAPVTADGGNIFDLGVGLAVGYLNADAEPITGLEVKRDPGLFLFWAAAVLVVLGGCLVFAVPWRRLWLRVEDRTLALKTRRLPESDLRKLLNPEGGGPL
ncbi:MAG TPA: cytochrome c biogenesis protein ResB [bacterium]|nr:cytochrome c biogenesis protein ResB [bacterium]